ncbi:MAG TPA: alpha/beta hydrolase [Rhizomicrobium sp.]|nr:alpha/beta hydrolase [Rhizomicrobium sp.]
MKKWLGRAALGIAALLLAALAAGMALEQLARARTPAQFPLAGRLVDIGGRRMQIDCRGQGSPTIVFEAGVGLWGSLNWSTVQDGAAKIARACTYSRAGVMWSDPAPSGPRDADAIARDLHALLRNAGERAPFVLVAHSMGSPYAVTYTQRFGTDVAGLVLVDPSHPDQTERAEAVTHRPHSYLTASLKLMPFLTWTGLPRLLLSAPPQGAPQEMRDKAWYSPAPLSAAAAIRETEAIGLTFSEVKAAHDLGARPLYVLTATASYSKPTLRELQMSPQEGEQFQLVWKGMQDDVATWSSASQHRLVPQSHHNLQFEQPQLVIHAIASVVEAARSHQPPKP